MSDLSSSVAGQDPRTTIGYTMIRKALDVAKSQGEEAVGLIKDAGRVASSTRTARGAITPNARPNGVPGRLDVKG